MEENNKWVEIAITIFAPQAVSWQDILIDEGIQVIVDPPANHIEPYPLTALSTPMRIYVLKEDEAKARDILDQMSSEEESAEMEE